MMSYSNALPASLYAMMSNSNVLPESLNVIMSPSVQSPPQLTQFSTNYYSSMLLSKLRAFGRSHKVWLLVVAFVVLSGPSDLPDGDGSSRNLRSDGCSVPDVSAALSCLHKTTPDLELTYPDDANEHVLEIQRAIEEWTNTSHAHHAAGFSGPWIENGWMEHFKNATSSASCLSDSFGPYIPLLVPWVDLWVNSGFQYPPGFVTKLTSVLRSDVPYITVSQNDQGIPGHDEFPQLPNILVLSAGGYGHVPVPLLKQPEELVKPNENRRYLISYAGSLDHSPKDLRKDMHASLQNLVNDSYTQFYSSSPPWQEIVQDSYVSMAPRGFGRTSYHLMECLQMGFIPVHVYDKDPWVPYGNLFEEDMGYSTSLEDLPQLVASLQNMTVQEFEDKEARIASYRESHFMMPGVMRHIETFLKTGKGDLKCQQLPSSIRMTRRTAETFYD